MLRASLKGRAILWGVSLRGILRMQRVLTFGCTLQAQSLDHWHKACKIAQGYALSTQPSASMAHAMLRKPLQPFVASFSANI